MSLLQKLKSALGLNGSESSEPGRSGDVDVTVEREPSTEDEDAVKGTETASSTTSTAAESDEFEDVSSTDGDSEDESADADTPDANADAESTDTDAEAEDESADADTPNADGEAAEEAAAEAEPPAEGSSDPVTELNGIGPAYGDRLAGVGIETVGELAVADPAEVAAEIDLGESRVAGWVEQAQSY